MTLEAKYSHFVSVSIKRQGDVWQGGDRGHVPVNEASFATENAPKCTISRATRRMAIANGTCVIFCTFWPPFIFNRFPVIQPVSSKVRHFSIFVAHFGTIAASVTWMERGFNAGQMHRSMYPSTFNRLRAIAIYWSEIATSSYRLAFNAPVGVFPLEKVWSSEN